MKSKNKTTEAFERFKMLERLKRQTCWLITSDRPVKEKLAIWHKDFEKLCHEMHKYGILR